MIWNRIELESWTFGLEFGGYIFTMHLGPLKTSYIVRGSQLYKDFKRTRNT